MLPIQKIDHVGIRVRDKDRAVSFYELLGFEFKVGGAFEQGHPIIMQHPSGVVINLLGPATKADGPNVLMDVDEKAAGYTHMALRVESLEATKSFLADNNIELTGSFSYGDLSAVFIRDPDNNVIEFDDYPGQQPGTRSGSYDDHP